MTTTEQAVIDAARAYRVAKEEAIKAGSPYMMLSSNPGFADARAFSDRANKAWNRLVVALNKLEIK